MKIFDRFLIRSFLGPLFLTIFIVLFVLVLQFLWVYIDELVGKGLGLRVILEFLLGYLHRHSHGTSPGYTAGLHHDHGQYGRIQRIAGHESSRYPALPYYASAYHFIFPHFRSRLFAANDLMPLAYKNIFALRDDISRTKDEIRIPTGIFITVLIIIALE